VRRYSGPLLMATGVLDLLVCLLLYPGPLGAIARGGFFNTVELRPPRLDREVAFWHVASGTMMVLLGALVHWAQARTATLPAFLGWSLLAFGAAGAILVPVSGFWAVLPQAGLILAVSRRHPARPARRLEVARVPDAAARRPPAAGTGPR
jgi:hypothetical protein